MSNDFMALLIMLLFVNPTTVEFSVWIVDLGFDHTISIRVLQIGTIVFAVMYRAESSDSDADSITYFIIRVMVIIGPLSFGVGSFSNRNIKAQIGCGLWINREIPHKNVPQVSDFLLEKVYHH